VLFPIGVVEEHGPHLDLSPDIYLTCLLARNMKAQLSAKGVEAVIAPPYYWGINEDTSGFPGSFSVKPETMQAVLRESIGALGRWGFDRVLLVSLHGDRVHRKTISALVEEMKANTSIRVQEIGPLLAGPFPPPKPGAYSPDFHAGANETKAMWDYYPGKVKPHIAKTLPPQPSFQPRGYAGNPAGFMETGQGREIIELLGRRAAERLQAQLEADKKK
jgi:creatinine amidohydrolase